MNDGKLIFRVQLQLSSSPSLVAQLDCRVLPGPGKIVAALAIPLHMPFSLQSRQLAGFSPILP
jgi:hypothetical protein